MKETQKGSSFLCSWGEEKSREIHGESKTIQESSGGASKSIEDTWTLKVFERSKAA